MSKTLVERITGELAERGSDGNGNLTAARYVESLALQHRLRKT
jgi:hypothetical protein